MFRNKQEVDRHVSSILNKTQNEHERLLKGYNFARLYFQVQDYETAKRYLVGFLSVRENHALAHKLLGQIFEATNNLENALHQYKRSLELDQNLNQKELVLKICWIYTQIPADPDTARYWLERGETLYPHHEIIYKLKECLLASNEGTQEQELEQMIKSELQHCPNNVNLVTKLLKLYLHGGRLEEAFKLGVEEERKGLATDNLDFYMVLLDICEAYEKELTTAKQSTITSFYTNYLYYLNKTVLLNLSEVHSLKNAKGSNFSPSLASASSTLYKFDQLLYKAHQIKSSGVDGSWNYFLKQMKGQLFFHLGTLIIKRTHKEQGNWKESFRMAAALFLVAFTFKPGDLHQENWFSRIEDSKGGFFYRVHRQAVVRLVQSAHIISMICKENQHTWLKKMKTEYCIPQVQERAFHRAFEPISNKQLSQASFFLNDHTYTERSLEFPHLNSLKASYAIVQQVYADSLHHLVWLILSARGPVIKSSDPDLNARNPSKTRLPFKFQIFETLQYSQPKDKLSAGGAPETLCRLDVEAFLHATVYCAETALGMRRVHMTPQAADAPLCVPADVAQPLCTLAQSSWWSACHDLVHGTAREKLAELRRTLQHGLEVIRAVGNHGLDVILTIHLAHVFADKATDVKEESPSDDEDANKIELAALEERAAYYWEMALGLLSRLAKNQTLRCPKDPLFPSSGGTLSQEEITAHREEGELYLACHAMNRGSLEEAAKIFEKLSSPHASYYLALCLKQLAERRQSPKKSPLNILNNGVMQRDFSLTTPPEGSIDVTSLLTKARNALYLTMDRIKGDPHHPLTMELPREIEEVETKLADGVVVTQGAAALVNSDEESPLGSPPSIERVCSPIGNISSGNMSSFLKSSPHYYTPPSKVKPPRPSIERLDAQIRALTHSYENLDKNILDLKKCFLETTKSLSNEVEQVASSMKKLEIHFKEFTEQAMKKSRRPHYPEEDAEALRILAEISDYEEDDLRGDQSWNFYGNNTKSMLVGDYRTSYAPSHYERPPTSVKHLPHHDPSAHLTATMGYPPAPPLPPGYPPPPAAYHYHLPPRPSAVPAHQPPTPNAPAPPPTTYFPPFSSAAGLQFTEGQHLPQFQFNIPPPQPIPPPPPATTIVTSLPPPPSFPAAPPAPLYASVDSTNSNETKTPVPHSYQISMPSTILTSVSSSTPFTTSTPSLSSSFFASPSLKLEKSPQTVTTVLPLAPSVGERQRQESQTSEKSDHLESSHDPLPDFKPIIPLPDEVDVQTGEENEKVIFEERAKLFRLVDKEWKERGIGVVKILLNEEGKYRLLMRRDQVLKICANHYIKEDMQLIPMKNSDKAWIWAAQDYADEIYQNERFCIRFKTAELAKSFKETFEKCINSIKTSTSNVSTTDSTLPIKTSTNIGFSSGFGDAFLPKPGSWSCTTCLVSNPPDKIACLACQEPKPGLSPVIKPATSSFSTPTTGSGFVPLFHSKSWNCKNCSLNNSSEKTSCEACQSPKPGSHAKTPDTSIIFGKTTPKTMEASFTPNISTPLALNQKFTPVGSETNVFSELATRGITLTSLATSSPATHSQVFTQIPATTATSIFGGNVFGGTSIFGNLNPATTCSPAEQASKPLSHLMSVTTPMQTSVFGQGALSSSGLFSKESNDGDSKALSKGFSFLHSTPDTKETKSSESKPNPFSNFSFTSTSKSSPVTFDSNKAQSMLATPLNNSTTSPSKINSAEEFTPTAEFKPVISLPELVETKTGEEEEEKLFGERAKLYRYDPNEKQWKEKGIGELKILRNPNTRKCRVLMRREQVLKICTNHLILPEMKLLPLQTTKFTWVWDAVTLEDKEMKSERLAARFKTEEQAQKFKNIFEECQNQVDSPIEPQVNEITSSVELSEKKLNTWECTACYSLNESFLSSCKNCFQPNFRKIEEEKTSKDQCPPDLSKPQLGAWECKSCSVKNSQKDKVCVSCGFPRPGLEVKSKEPLPLSELFKPEIGSWECTSCYVRNNGKTDSCIACGSRKPESSTKASQEPKPVFKFGMPSSDFTFSASPLKSEGFVFGGITTLSNSSGFVFGSSSPFKPTASSETKETSPSSNEPLPPSFKFGSPQKYEFNFGGIRSKSPIKTGPKSPGTPQDISREDDEVEQVEADIFFQPVIPLPPKVTVQSGEENETVLYCHRAKLFRFVQGEWKERGIGEIKILKNNTTHKLRLLMRREQVLKVCLNHQLTKDLKFISKGEKAWMWAAKDFAEGEETDERFTLRFKTEEIAQEFKNALDKALEATEMKSPKDDSSSSQTDLTPKPPHKDTSSRTPPPKQEKEDSSADSFLANAPKSEDIEIVYERKASPEQIAKARELCLPPNFYLYENAPPCPGCRGCKDLIPEYTDHSEKGDQNVASMPISSPFSQPSSLPQPPSGSMFSLAVAGEGGGISFADLATQSSGKDFISASGKKSCFNFPGAGSKVFGSTSTSEQAQDGAENDEIVPPAEDIHFEPVVPLPDLVEVQTGEEEEFPIFCQRAKLFRFDADAQQWKERGVGDFKILKHNELWRYRLLLRRDQVHKVVCNQYISASMQLAPLATSETSLCWAAKDYSENPQGNYEKLAIRFKTKELKDEFKAKFEECQKALRENRPTLPPGSQPSSSPITSEKAVPTTSSPLQPATTTTSLSCQNLRKELSESTFSGVFVSTSSPVSSSEAFVMVSSANQDDNAVTTNSHSEEEEEEEEEYDDDEEDDDDLEKMIMYEDVVVFSLLDLPTNEYRPAGRGKIQVVYDENVYGARIYLFNEDGSLFSDHHIAIQTCLRTEGLSGYWAAMDNVLEPPARRLLCCRFPSRSALEKFVKTFEEGKELALQAEIKETEDFPIHPLTKDVGGQKKP